MKILMLGWELPPNDQGYLGKLNLGLTRALSELGEEVIFAMPKVTGEEPAGHMRLASLLPPKEWTGEIRERERRARAAQPPQPSLHPSDKPAFTLAQAGQVRPRKPTATSSFFHKHQHYGHEQLELVAHLRASAPKVLREVGCDLIHAHDWMTMPMAVELKRLTGKRLVVQLYGLESHRSGAYANSKIEEIEREGVKAADRILVPSHWARHFVKDRFGLEEHKVAVIHNGVSREESSELHLSPKPVQDVKTVLFVGPFIFQRGPETFIDAAAKVIQHYNKVRFVMSGSGEKLEASIRRVNEWGLSKHFHFTGFLSGELMEEMFLQADVYVVPAAEDPFGLLPIEAAFWDTPMIVTRQSGLNEVVRHALKIDFWDVHKIADRILAVLRYEPLAQEMVKNAQREALHLHWRAAAEKIQGLYRGLIQPH